MRGHMANLTGLETLLLSDNFKITELDIHSHELMMGWTHVLQALGRRPALAKLILHGICLDPDEARQPGMAVRHTPSLQSLDGWQCATLQAYRVLT
jgi:hypothetical protein